MSNLLTRKQVSARCQLARTTVYRLMRSGEFPEPVRVGVRAVRWREAEIDEWLASRPRSSGDGIRRCSRRAA